MGRFEGFYLSVVLNRFLLFFMMPLNAPHGFYLSVVLNRFFYIEIAKISFILITELILMKIIFKRTFLVITGLTGRFNGSIRYYKN